MFAARNIPKGTLIVEYWGDVLAGQDDTSNHEYYKINPLEGDFHMDFAPYRRDRNWFRPNTCKVVEKRRPLGALANGARIPAEANASFVDMRGPWEVLDLPPFEYPGQRDDSKGCLGKYHRIFLAATQNIKKGAEIIAVWTCFRRGRAPAGDQGRKKAPLARRRRKEGSLGRRNGASQSHTTSGSARGSSHSQGTPRGEACGTL